MPFYEFSCSACEIAFGLSLEFNEDITTLFCVECGANELTLTAYDEELSLKLAGLVESVNELTYRVKQIEDEIDVGPDIAASKNTPKAN